MPGCGGNPEHEARRVQKGRDVEKKLIAKGLHPKSNGFARAWHAAMRKPI